MFASTHRDLIFTSLITSTRSGGTEIRAVLVPEIRQHQLRQAALDVTWDNRRLLASYHSSPD